MVRQAGWRRTGLVIVAVVSLMGAACSSDDDSDSSASTTTTEADSAATNSTTTSTLIEFDTTIGTAQTEFGEVLTDNFGYTLYVFDEDIGQPGPTCVDDCSDKWPPLLVDTLDPPADLDAELGLVDTGSGYQQVTINGRPAYTMAEEFEPGQTLCQGGDGVWWVVGTDGEAITTTEPITTTTGLDDPFQ
jgi:predicted lipoprotein with Yx(FWY)xxD motif